MEKNDVFLPLIDINPLSADLLERQVERASLFTHTALSRQSERINEIESFLFGMIDQMIKKALFKKKN